METKKEIIFYIVEKFYGSEVISVIYLSYSALEIIFFCLAGLNFLTTFAPVIIINKTISMFNFNMLGKLQEMKKTVDEMKDRLEAVSLESESKNGEIKVVVSGNRKIKSIEIKEELLIQDKAEIERKLLQTLNDVIEKADKLNESEMKNSLKGMLPLPGLF